MAVRLIGLARISSCLLVPKFKPVAPQTRTYLLKRERLVPFLDDDPCVFSKKAIMHHWGALAIIVITVGALAVGVLCWLKIALTRHDVFYGANTAFYEILETRQGPWYKCKYLKFVRINQRCKIPRDLLLAKGIDVSSSSFADTEPEDGFFGNSVVVHAIVLPIIGICSFGLLAKIFVIMALGMKKDDVWFTKDSAYCDTFETRRGPWYKYRSRKWGGRDDYTMPADATLARQGYTDGPSFSEETEEEGLTVKEVAAHVAVTAVAITVAAAIL